MVTIETFFVLSAIVVLIGLVVWRRDLKSGRILKPKVLSRSRMVRDLFADTRSPAMGAGAPDPAADAKPRAKPREDGAKSA